MAEIGKDISKAVDLLKQGKLVAIPTETVYGLAANALNVDAVTKIYTEKKDKGLLVAGQKILTLITINGIRVTLEDGTWGLVRASSNKPELVVVVESPVSEARMRAMFAAVDGVLRENSEVGAYNQTI